MTGAALSKHKVLLAAAGLRGAKARTQIFPRSRSIIQFRSAFVLSCRPLFLPKLSFAQKKLTFYIFIKYSDIYSTS